MLKELECASGQSQLRVTNHFPGRNLTR